MTNLSENQQYRIVLKKAPARSADSVAAELVLLLPVDLAMARQIVEAAPVILLDKLTGREAANADSHLGFLRRLGADVEIAPAGHTSLKRLNFRSKPDITCRPGNTFVCPICGDRLVVSSRAETAAVSPESAQEPVKPQVSQEKSPAVDSAKSAPKTEEAAENVMPAEEKPHAEPQKPRQTAERPPKGGRGRWSPEEGGKDAAPEHAPQKEEELDEVVEEPAIAEQTAPLEIAPEQPAKPEGGSYRVSVTKKLKPPKKKAAAELIAKYQGVDDEKARKAASRAVFTIARKVSKEQAEECKKECKARGIPVQVTSR
jgi:hypothetical protein